MRILVNAHKNYTYHDATVIQGLMNLGHTVWGVGGNRASYLPAPPSPEPKPDLFVQCMSAGPPMPGVKSISIWGLDNHTGLDKAFDQGHEAVFVRDLLPGERGVPFNFGIEDRYYCVTRDGYKPLKDREIDVCFLGQLYPYRTKLLNQLRSDFKKYNLVFGDREFTQPDTVWSPHTLPWCAHDTQYFEMLANSKICLSLRGEGPDCARHWEVMASGGIPVIEAMPTIMIPPEPRVLWFSDYVYLRDRVQNLLDNIEAWQGWADRAFQWDRQFHSTAARAEYMLDKLGL